MDKRRVILVIQIIVFVLNNHAKACLTGRQGFARAIFLIADRFTNAVRIQFQRPFSLPDAGGRFYNLKVSELTRVCNACLYSYQYHVNQ